MILYVCQFPVFLFHSSNSGKEKNESSSFFFVAFTIGVINSSRKGSLSRDGQLVWMKLIINPLMWDPSFQSKEKTLLIRGKNKRFYIFSSHETNILRIIILERGIRPQIKSQRSFKIVELDHKIISNQDNYISPPLFFPLINYNVCRPIKHHWKEGWL